MGTLKVFLWEPFNLQIVRKDGDFVVILPSTYATPFESGDSVGVCVAHRGILKEIARAKIRNRRQVPLGRVMETEWAAHIGPRDKEIYIGEVGRVYRQHIDDFGLVSVLTLRTVRVCDEILEPMKNAR